MEDPVRVLVLFYSFSGKTAELADSVAEGAAQVAGVEVTVRRVPELLPDAFFEGKAELKKVKDGLEEKYPMATIDDLINADAVAFGSPTHFGSFASQLKQFIDSCTPAWLKGKLINKPAAVFCSAGSMHGGEELTLLSLIIPLINLGMIPIGIPFPIQGESPDFDAGSPYGAIFVSGHGHTLTDADKKVARILGMRLATMAKLLNCGCESCGLCHDLTKKIV